MGSRMSWPGGDCSSVPCLKSAPPSPAHGTAQVHEAPPTHLHLALSPPTELLSEEQLDAVVGGMRADWCDSWGNGYPGQEANPGQEFVILKVRATNPSPAEVQMRKAPLFPQEGTEYLRLEADNGVLLQPSAALNALPTEFPARAEQDALYAWQIPLGSQNPTLVILAPDGSEARLP